MILKLIFLLKYLAESTFMLIFAAQFRMKWKETY